MLKITVHSHEVLQLKRGKVCGTIVFWVVVLFFLALAMFNSKMGASLRLVFNQE